MRSVVVYAGFLIGRFDEKDPLHARCRGFLRDFAVYRLGGRTRFIDVLGDA